MRWLEQAALWLPCAVIVFLAWLNDRWEKRAHDALALAARFGEERDALAWWLSFQGWEVDLEDGVRIWRPEGDPEEERLAR